MTNGRRRQQHHCDCSPKWNTKIISSMKAEKKKNIYKNGSIIFPLWNIFSGIKFLFVHLFFSKEIFNDWNISYHRWIKKKKNTRLLDLSSIYLTLWPDPRLLHQNKTKEKNSPDNSFRLRQLMYLLRFGVVSFLFVVVAFFVCFVHGPICVCTFAVYALNFENMYS